ncbi:MAG: response regulator [Mediterranea sp.]|jgi:signal transduction histidine kinase/ligand-binding sensor domain-containing protein/DNA-binding response OmpR family regulator|nr:response regulator [Mediterranea sp.]
MCKWNFVLICLLSFSVQLTADEEDILFNHLDVNNGLSSNEVSCIYKDKKGFMWFGTGVGLTRFDGYEFRTFRHEINNSLFSEEYIMQIIETADENLWITYQDGKISIYNPHKNRFFTVNELYPNLNIVNVFHEKSGQLFFGTSVGELCRYDFTTKEMSYYGVDKVEGNVCGLFQKDNLLYAIHRTGTIEIIDVIQNKCILKDGYLNMYVNTLRFNLFVDTNGELWIYMNPENCNGLFHFNPETRHWTHYSMSSATPLTSSLIRAVEEDSNGLIWIATDHGGINLLDKEKGTITYLKNNPFDPKSISQNSVICLYKDDTGIIWCGTYKTGINYYHESIFKFKSIRFPIFEAADAGINDCNCVYEDASGNLWIGTNGNGLLYFDQITHQYRKYQHDSSNPNSLNSNIVVCLTGDSKGNLWIGTYMGGLDCFNGKTFRHYVSKGRGINGLSSNSVYSLYADENNRLWIGTLGGGLDCFNLETYSWNHFNTSDTNNTLMSDNIYSISKGIGDKILIGTVLGVNVLDTWDNKISVFHGTKDSSFIFSKKTINTVFIDSRDLMWIGSNNGLNIYDAANDKLYSLDKTNGLPDNAVMSILEDDHHTLWFGTKNGLLKIDPQYDAKENTYIFPCTVYYEDEGIQGRIFNRNSICRTSGGKLILGGTNGLTIFDPLQIKYNSYPPEAIVTGFLLQNEQIFLGDNDNLILQDDISYIKSLTLKYNENSFALVISAFNYFLPKKNKFSYIMEGFDKKWTTINAANRNITYTNLPPGNYTFMLKAENNDGIISKTPLNLRITIYSPLWAAPWAILFYIIIGVLFIYVMVKAIIRIQKNKFKKEQERIVAGKLHEMDEMKLRFFTNISHEFRTPLTLIMASLDKLMKSESDVTYQNMLKLIHENANQLLSLVNQLLDFWKIDMQGTQLLLSSGDIVLFVRNIVYSFKDISEKKSILFSFSSAFPSFSMSFDTDKVFKIISNLLSNAFKFTPEGGEISVTLQIDQQDNGDKVLLIQVSDTGIGIAPEQKELIFNRFYQVPLTDKTGMVTGTGIGLHLCREFAKIHNGSITVKSELEKGSTFCLSLPVIVENIQEIISTSNTLTEANNILARENIVGSPILLIVDDNTNFREFMKQSLIDTYNVLMAADGIDAWKIILENLPDMVVSDVMMPGLDGIELCKLIKEDIRTSHIPVILLTAKSAETSKLSGLEAGADDYIEKPFNMDILLLKIRHIIDFKNRMQKQLLQSMQSGIQLTHSHVSSLDEQLIRKSINFIEEQMSNPELSVEWLSKEMGMSRTNFYKKILSITGKTPVELIRAIRMKHAAQLLEKSQLRISEVAFKVGVNDNKLFRKYFKEEFGRLPSELSGNKKVIHYQK